MITYYFVLKILKKKVIDDQKLKIQRTNDRRDFRDLFRDFSNLKMHREHFQMNWKVILNGVLLVALKYPLKS